MRDLMSDLTDIMWSFNVSAFYYIAPLFITFILFKILTHSTTSNHTEQNVQERVIENTTKIQFKSVTPMYQIYLNEIKSISENIFDSDISQNIENLFDVLQKVPKHYLSEDKYRVGKYYIPELLSLLRSYHNLANKDEESKTNILEAIETVTNVAKSILDTLEKNEKTKLEIDSDVLNQVAKMDGYLTDMPLNTYPEKLQLEL